MYKINAKNQILHGVPACTDAGPDLRYMVGVRSRPLVTCSLPRSSASQVQWHQQWKPLSLFLKNRQVNTHRLHAQRELPRFIHSTAPAFGPQNDVIPADFRTHIPQRRVRVPCLRTARYRRNSSTAVFCRTGRLLFVNRLGQRRDANARSLSKYTTCSAHINLTARTVADARATCLYRRQPGHGFLCR